MPYLDKFGTKFSNMQNFYVISDSRSYFLSGLREKSFASLLQSTSWSEAKDLKYFQLLLQASYLRVGLKRYC